MSDYVIRDQCEEGCCLYGRDMELECFRPINEDTYTRPMFQHLPLIDAADEMDAHWLDAASWPEPEAKWDLGEVVVWEGGIYTW